jgi:thioredoxin reductase
MSAPEIYDLTMIGGGPSGLFGLYYAGLRMAKAKVIDRLPELGGQLTALYPQKYVYDVAGFPRILARDLVDNLVKQAMQYDHTVCLSERVEGLERVEDRLIRLRTDKGEHLTRTVVLAGGMGAFLPRKLDTQDVGRLVGRGMYYIVRDIEPFKGKRVLIVGGGNTAVDWALTLENVCKKVTLIHLVKDFSAHEDSVRKLFRSRVDVRTFYELKAVYGEEHVEGARVFNNRDKTELYLEVEAIILNIGFLANLGPIKEWGLTIEGNAIKVNERMETGLPGVYAAGDIVTHPGKIKLIATGASEAAIAVNNAKNYLDQSARVQPPYTAPREAAPGKGAAAGIRASNQAKE